MSLMWNGPLNMHPVFNFNTFGRLEPSSVQLKRWFVFIPSPQFLYCVCVRKMQFIGSLATWVSSSKQSQSMVVASMLRMNSGCWQMVKNRKKRSQFIMENFYTLILKGWLLSNIWAQVSCLVSFQSGSLVTAAPLVLWTSAVSLLFDPHKFVWQ